MALFGSLGKMLGLDTPFGRGLVTGFAETTADTVRDDMENERERIDRIADYKIKKNEEELAEYRKEYEDNLEKIRAMQGLTGSLAGAEYMIRTYGMEEGLKQAQAIDVLKGYGVKPEFVSEENATTIEDLTNFITNAPQLSTVGKIEGTGLLSKIGLGRDIGADAQRQVDQATSELAYGVKQPVELGAVPMMKGVDPEDLGMMVDIKDEANRLVRLAIRAKENGDDEGYRKYMTDATTLRNAITASTATPLSEAGGRSMLNLLEGNITQISGVDGDFMPDGLGGYMYKGNFKDKQDRAKVLNASAQLAEMYAEAIKNNVPTAQALRVVTEASTSNKIPVIGDDGMGGKTFVLSDMPLIDGGIQGGTGAYEPPPDANTIIPPSTTAQPSATTNQMPTQVTPGIQTSQIVPSAPVMGIPKYISDLAKLYKASTDMTERSSILAKIGRKYNGTIPKNVLDLLN
jgi:hypothetical protein